MARFILRYFDIRPGEGRRVGLMLVYIFLLIAVVLMVKSVSTSFFLSNLGVEKLPAAFILVAIASIVIFSLYIRHEMATSLSSRTQGTLIFSVVSLLVIRALLLKTSPPPYLFYLIYLWGALFGVTVTAQFWLLANTIFTAREAKRFFSVFGSGAIAGGIFGGYTTNVLLHRIQSENLLIIAAVLLIICIFIANSIFIGFVPVKNTAKNKASLQSPCSKKKESPIHIIKTSGLLSSAMLLIGLSVLCATFVDYQFNALASETYKDPDHLAGFIGFWLSTLSLASLIIQLLLAPRMVNLFGVCPSLAVLPIGITVGAFGVFLSPSLISVVFLKVTGGSLRNSIYKSSLELLFVPVPAHRKQQIKTFTDVVSDNVATGISGVLLIFFTQLLGFSVKEISFILVVLSGIQISIILNARKHYINAFREAIRNRNINFNLDATVIHDSRLITALLKELDTYNERQLFYVLQLINSIENMAVYKSISPLTNHHNPEIRCKAISLLVTYEKHDATEMMQGLLGDSDCNVQIHALKYLASKSSHPGRYLARQLDKCDSSEFTAALLCAAYELSLHPDDKYLHAAFSLKVIHLLDEESSCKALITAANAIAESGQSSLFPYLLRLFDHPDIEVQKAAVAAGGKCRYHPTLSRIISLLKKRKIRLTARNALMCFGASFLPEALKIISNEETDLTTRRELIKAIGGIHKQESADMLLWLLNIRHQSLTSDIIHSLQRLRNDAPALIFASEKAEQFIRDTVERYWILRNALNVVQQPLNNDKVRRNTQSRQARRLLVKALEEKLFDYIKYIFLTLGLYYNSQDIACAFQSLKSNSRQKSAHSLEFLESILQRNNRSVLMQVAEDYVMRTIEEYPYLQNENTPLNESAALISLLDYTDNWIQTCSLFLLGTIRASEHMDSIQKYHNHSNPIIRDTARWAIRPFVSSPEDVHIQC